MTRQFKGMILIIIGTVSWGFGGTIAQILFHDYHLQVVDYVKLRLLISGILLLILSTLMRQNIFEPFRQRIFVWQIIIYSIFGMLAVQYTYMASISAGNAAVATLLQYLAPVVILIYYLLSRKKPLRIADLIIIIISMFGTFLLLTNGDIQSLTVPKAAIAWGVASAVAAAYYIMYAENLFKHAPSLTVVGWAMLIGGIGMSIIRPKWTLDISVFNTRGWVLLSLSIIVGTMLAFWIYLESVKYIEAEIVALLGCLEPLTAVLLSAVWLKVSFGYIQLLGMFIILGIVIYSSLKKDSTAIEQ